MYQELFRFYACSLKARLLDERLQQLFYANRNQRNATKSFFSGIGSEVGVSAITTQLDHKDWIIPHYRGFAEVIGKGMPIRSIVAEIFGKKVGYAKGIGDAYSFRDKDHHIYGSSIVLGSNFSVSIGLGLAKKLKNENAVIVVFFGDGESSRSTFGSALNIASLWELPILFVCRNNGISIDTKIEDMSSTKTIAERARGYNLDSITISDTEPICIYEESKKAISFVRNNQKPFLLEIKERRFSSHSLRTRCGAFLGDAILKQDDPLQALEVVLIKMGIPKKKLAECREKAIDEIDNEIASSINKKKISLEEFFSIYNE